MSASAYPFAGRVGMRVSFVSALVMLGIFGLLPAIGVLALSFTDVRGLPGIPVTWVGLRNYASFFSAAHLGDSLRALGNTLEFATVSTIGQILLGLAIALLLNKRLRGVGVYRAIVFLPTVLGVTVVGLIWSLIFNPSGGPAAALLGVFGQSSAFFGDAKFSLLLVALVQIWTQSGLSVVIFLAGLQAIPEEVLESAAIDGASGWQRTRLVVLPMLAPAITTNVLFGIVNALQSYQLAYVLTGPNYPPTQLLSTQIFVIGFGGVPGSQGTESQGYASAISMVQFLLVGVITLIALFYLRRKEARL